MTDCRTQYPILLVHGLNCRDEVPFFYWGRVPALLTAHGARVYLSGQDACGTIGHNARTLEQRMRQVLAAEDSEKLNLIAHSKGGLEARYCISTLGLADRVASLTTICTPHHGSKTAAAWQRRPLARMALAGAEDLYWSLRGDDQPDFRAVLEELTPAAMERFNRANPDSPQVYYQSWGARLEKQYHGEGGMARFLLALTGADGLTDGLVSPDSAVWGHWRGTLERVSHLDAADSRGRDLPHFSVSDFYLRLVRELAEMGF